MVESNSLITCPPMPLSSLSLKKVEGQWLASPAPGARDKELFLPFYIPFPPRSLIDWMVIAGHRFWRQRRRCLCGLLLVDSDSAHWTIRFPQQRCGTDHVEWAISRAPFTNLPDSMRIAGTFQTAGHDVSERQHAPSVDGFHFVLHVAAQKPMVACVRHGGEIESIDPLKIIVNDWATTIDAAVPRLRIA